MLDSEFDIERQERYYKLITRRGGGGGEDEKCRFGTSAGNKFERVY